MMFGAPQRIETEVFAEVPARLRRSGTPPERLAAGKSATPAGCFLEGPAFDRAGNQDGKIVPVVSRHHQQGFKGVNYLTFSESGDLYFTDRA